MSSNQSIINFFTMKKKNRVIQNFNLNLLLKKNIPKEAESVPEIVKEEIKSEKPAFSWGNVNNNIPCSLFDVENESIEKNEKPPVIEKKRPTRDEIRRINYIKTRMCESYRNGVECRNRKCTNAHSGAELRDKLCEFNPCNRVIQISDDKYENVDKRRICGAVHFNESDDNFYTRVTGIKNRPTEEDMEKSYEEFLEYIKSGKGDTKQKVDNKDKNQYQKYKPLWPKTFEEFTNLSLEKIKNISNINKIYSHYTVKTNRRSISQAKTISMLFLELIKLAEKQYPQEKDDIKLFENKLKKEQENIEQKLKNTNVKEKPLDSKDILKLCIGEKNSINIKINDNKNKIKRSEEIIKRFRTKNITDFEKKQIDKYNVDIVESRKKIEELEKQLSEFQDIKKFEEYLLSSKK